MLKQLTLFQNIYVNKSWQLNYGKYGRKQDFLSAVRWERIKNDKTGITNQQAEMINAT